VPPRPPILVRNSGAQFFPGRIRHKLGFSTVCIHCVLFLCAASGSVLRTANLTTIATSHCAVLDTLTIENPVRVPAVYLTSANLMFLTVVSINNLRDVSGVQISDSPASNLLLKFVSIVGKHFGFASLACPVQIGPGCGGIFRIADHPPSTSFALLRTTLCRSARNEGAEYSPIELHSHLQ